MQLDDAGQLKVEMDGRPDDRVGNEAGRVGGRKRCGEQILSGMIVGTDDVAADGRLHARVQEVGQHVCDGEGGGA